MSKKFVFVDIHGLNPQRIGNGYKNGYLVPAGTSIFYTRMLTGRVRVS